MDGMNSEESLNTDRKEKSINLHTSMPQPIMISIICVLYLKKVEENKQE